MADYYALQLLNVSKSYTTQSESLQILNNATLEIRVGERVALLGPSGSGKTTLLNIAAGLDQADDGDVLIKSRSISEIGEHERSLLRRRHLGFIFQSFNLFPQLTAAANIRVSLKLNSLKGDYWQTLMRQLMQRMGIEHLAERYPHQMSGGEQQRVAIARALVHQPAIVLADEPTGNLDQAHANEVLKIIEEVSSDCGLLLVTHSRRAAAICHRVLQMEAGQPQPFDLTQS